MLKPVENYRSYTPHVCGHCRYFDYDRFGGAVCERPDPIDGKEFVVGATGDNFEWEHTCNRWVSLHNNRFQLDCAPFNGAIESP